MAENVIEFNDQNFDSDVLEAETPVLVDFGLCGVDHASNRPHS